MNRCLPLLLCLAFPLAASAQAPDAPTIRTGTQIVVVDANVTDSRGNPVHGLKLSDFTLLEDGKPQPIKAFEEHVAPAAGTLAKLPQMPKLEPGVYTNYSPVPENLPLNILLLDSLNTPMQDQSYARQQILKFLKSLKPGTRIAIFGLSTRLYLLQGFTSNPELLQAALRAHAAKGQNSPLLPDAVGTETQADQMADAFGNDPGIGQVVANLQQFEAEAAAQQDRMRALYTLTAMNQLARYLSSMPGRKNLIWFSGSFPINILPDGSLTDPFAVMGSVGDEFRETTDLLAQSQVAVYPVDARGLFNAPMLNASNSGAKYAKNPKALGDDLSKFSQQTTEEHGTMRQIAEATGGKAFVDTNDLRSAVDEAINAGSNYYTLIYSPAKKTWDGGYRKITLHLASGNDTLSYRRGYYADDPAAPPAHRANAAASQTALPHIDVMQAAMQRGAPVPTQLLFKVRIEPGPIEDTVASGSTAFPKAKPPYRRFFVTFSANPGDIKFPQQSDGSRRLALQFVTLVYDRDGDMLTSASYPIQSVLKPDVFKGLIENGVQYSQEVSVPAKGEYFLRIGVRDLIGNKIGAVEVPVADVPSAPAKVQPPPR